MNLLLDTHILVWGLLDSSRLSPQVANQLSDPEAQRWLSPITVWEVLLLYEKGRIRFREPPHTWMRDKLVQMGFRTAPLNNEVALTSREVDLAHQDPADRFLVATAAVYDLTLVTADEKIIHSKSCAILVN